MMSVLKKSRRTVAAETVPEAVLISAGVTVRPGDADTIPDGLRVAAAWSWRILLVAVLASGLLYGLTYLGEVTIPLLIALLLAALLLPVTEKLSSFGLPRALATIVTVLVTLGLVGGLLILVVNSIVAESTSLGDNLTTSFTQLTTWLQNGPLHVNPTYFDTAAWTPRLTHWAQTSQHGITTYAAEIGISIGHFLAGAAIALFALFYFLYNGRSIFTFCLRFIPKASRASVDTSAQKGWTSLSSYVRATIVVALSDGAGVLIAAMILGVPAAPALAALVFIGAFVPIVGAFVSGFVAVVIALIALGWVKALIMLGAIILVLEIESHILQPFLMGRAVKLHPLAVLLAIAVGVITGGIVGALFAVPLLAFTKTFVQNTVDDTPEGSLAAQPTADTART